ncbi:M56 family metallopeptidase [Sphingobacterium faecium]|uniref:M56 family metallopeptidase n=1 Tax=Sphingobacterium faecium TaxID=34087 RepID=UPI0024687130|nr:M56 family metallopeptidase [Sphingobacterium faecium]MDH5825369.1 TonB-dependent receptor plug domain-containing protein [Sphingobacterium faecium]
MENILNYAIQINVLLSIVYLGYIFLLKDLTFYKLNRMYFLAGILFSFAYPFLDIRSWFSKPIPSVGEIAMDWSLYLGDETEQSSYTLNNLLIIILIMGVAMLAFRFVVQMISLLRIHIYSEPAQWQTYLFRNVFVPIVPFSFLNKIYVNRDHHAEPELLDIFKHEDIHVKGLHSIDILISEFTLICSWFNPLVWLMRKAIRENLEFLTDQQVISNGVDKQTYQYSLLHVNQHAGAVTLGNQFSFKTLKRRIMMMNKKRSAKIQIGKYAFMLPVLVLTAGAFTLNSAEAKITQVIDAAKDISLEPIASAVQSADSLVQITQDTLKGRVAGVAVVDNSIVVVGTKSDSSRIAVPSNEDPEIVKIRNATLNSNVYYVVDGQKVSADDFANLDPNDIESMSVLKGNSAVSKYGVKAIDGAIEITTKSGAKSNAGKSNGDDNSYKHTPKGFINAKGNKIGLILLEGKEVAMDEVNKVPEDKLSVKALYTGEKAIQLYGEKGKNGVVELRDRRFTIAVQDTSKSIKVVKSDKPDPLFVLDGKIYNAKMKDIKAEDIAAIEIIKGANAQELYGDRAVNGVIIITSKASKNAMPDIPKAIKKTINSEISKERQRQDSIVESKATKLQEVTIIGYKKEENKPDK